jgi:hypothetical protein
MGISSIKSFNKDLFLAISKDPWSLEVFLGSF